MSETLEIICMILIGWAGVAIVAAFQMQSINDSNPNVNIKQVIKMYFSKTFFNTIASMLVVVFYSLTHEEWIMLFSNNNTIPYDALIKAIIPFVMIVSFFVGGAFQYGIYKVIFRKIDLAMKRFDPNIKPYTNIKP